MRGIITVFPRNPTLVYAERRPMRKGINHATPRCFMTHVEMYQFERRIFVATLQPSLQQLKSHTLHHVDFLASSVERLMTKTPTSIGGGPPGNGYSLLATPSSTSWISDEVVNSEPGSFFRKAFVMMSRTRGFSCLTHQSLAQTCLSKTVSSLDA